jgi:hypothetical protein
MRGTIFKLNLDAPSRIKHPHDSKRKFSDRLHSGVPNPCDPIVARPPTYMSAERLMTLTLAECSQHARQCKEYSSKTDSKEVRKFLLRMEKVWIKLAAEKEAEVRVGARLGT